MSFSLPCEAGSVSEEWVQHRFCCVWDWSLQYNSVHFKPITIWTWQTQRCFDILWTSQSMGGQGGTLINYASPLPWLTVTYGLLAQSSTWVHQTHTHTCEISILRVHLEKCAHISIYIYIKLHWDEVCIPNSTNAMINGPEWNDSSIFSALVNIGYGTFTFMSLSNKPIMEDGFQTFSQWCAVDCAVPIAGADEQCVWLETSVSKKLFSTDRDRHLATFIV